MKKHPPDDPRQRSLFDPSNIRERDPEIDPVWLPRIIPTQANTTLAEARKQVQALIRVGSVCPCCDQIAFMHRFAFGSVQAWTLIQLHRYFQQRDCEPWAHLQTITGRNDGAVSKPAHWGLMEERSGIVRVDGGKHAGQWRLTDQGTAFVLNEITIPSHALLFNSSCFGLQGKQITIRQALKKKFSYDELMNG